MASERKCGGQILQTAINDWPNIQREAQEVSGLDPQVLNVCSPVWQWFATLDPVDRQKALLITDPVIMALIAGVRCKMKGEPGLFLAYVPNGKSASAVSGSVSQNMVSMVTERLELDVAFKSWTELDFHNTSTFGVRFRRPPRAYTSLETDLSRKLVVLDSLDCGTRAFVGFQLDCLNKGNQEEENESMVEIQQLLVKCLKPERGDGGLRSQSLKSNGEFDSLLLGNRNQGKLVTGSMAGLISYGMLQGLIARSKEQARRDWRSTLRCHIDSDLLTRYIADWPELVRDGFQIAPPLEVAQKLGLVIPKDQHTRKYRDVNSFFSSLGLSLENDVSALIVRLVSVRFVNWFGTDDKVISYYSESFLRAITEKTASQLLKEENSVESKRRKESAVRRRKKLKKKQRREFRKHVVAILSNLLSERVREKKIVKSMVREFIGSVLLKVYGEIDDSHRKAEQLLVRHMEEQHTIDVKQSESQVQHETQSESHVQEIQPESHVQEIESVKLQNNTAVVVESSNDTQSVCHTAEKNGELLGTVDNTCMSYPCDLNTTARYDLVPTNSAPQQMSDDITQDMSNNTLEQTSQRRRRSSTITMTGYSSSDDESESGLVDESANDAVSEMTYVTTDTGDQTPYCKANHEREILPVVVGQDVNAIPSANIGVVTVPNLATGAKPTRNYLEPVILNNRQQLAHMLHNDVVEMGGLLDVLAERRKAWQMAVAERIKSMVYMIWNGGWAEVYGSIGTGLAAPCSDIDMVIRGVTQHDRLEVLAEHLERQEWVQMLQAIPHATVPVVKLTTACIPIAFGNKGSLISVDITFENETHHGLTTMYYVRQLVNDYPLLKPLTLVLKQFLVEKGLNDPFTGGLSSYGLVLMITAVLLQHPRLNGTASTPASYGHAQQQVYWKHPPGQASWKLGAQHVSPNPSVSSYHGDDTYNPMAPNLGEVLLCFLETYSNPQFIENGVSIAAPFSQRVKPHNAIGAALFIADPLDESNNVGRSCFGVHLLMHAFREALEAMQLFAVPEQCGITDWSLLGCIFLTGHHQHVVDLVAQVWCPPERPVAELVSMDNTKLRQW